MFLHDFKDSISSLKAYSRLKSYKLKKSIFYWLSIAIVSSIIMVVSMYFATVSDIEAKIDKQYNQIPNFTLTDGVLEVEGDMPFTFDFGGNAVYVDTNEDFELLIATKYHSQNNETIYIGKNGYGKVEGTTLVNAGLFKYVKQLDDVSVNKDDFTIIKDLVRKMNYDSYSMMLVAIVPVFILTSIIIVSWYALLLKLVSVVIGYKVKYIECFNISVYGTTLMWLLCGPIVAILFPNYIFEKMMVVTLIVIYYLLIILLKLYKQKRGD